jgi:hypothetical protein
MINFNDVNWLHPGIKADRVERDIRGKSLCILIDNITAHIIHVDIDFQEFLYSITDFEDGGCINEEEDIFCIKLIKDGQVIEELYCYEMLYALLLSNPKFATIEEHHKYKYYVADGWHYIDGQFIIPGEME